MKEPLLNSNLVLIATRSKGNPKLWGVMNMLVVLIVVIISRA